MNFSTWTNEQLTARVEELRGIADNPGERTTEELEQLAQERAAIDAELEKRRNNAALEALRRQQVANGGTGVRTLETMPTGGNQQQNQQNEAEARAREFMNTGRNTIPVEEALDAVRSDSNPELTTRQKHIRECFVVLKEGADAAKVEKEIVEMPNYFSDYDTTVHFISAEELKRDHSGLAHGGFVFRSGSTGINHEHKHVIEFSLKLDSNPEFTSSVIIAYARAIKRLCDKGDTGCKTVFDIPPVLLSEMSPEEMRSHLL